MPTSQRTRTCRFWLAIMLALVLLPPATPGAAAGPGAWSPAASMAVARDRLLLTALANGKVLASSTWTPISTEIYDPATDSWTPTGDPVDYHSTATLLPSGKVL